MKYPISPKKLTKGDKIAVISPAGATELSQIENTLRLIKNRGYEPVLSEHCLGLFDEQGYAYSGTEAERLSDLQWAMNNPEFSAIWATRGGYGCQHLIKHLDLSQFKNNPKWYIGYSDNTAMQSFLLKSGYQSISGQTLKTSSFGVCDKAYPMIFDILEGFKPKFLVEENQYNEIGYTKGQIVGGNLALIYALLGTPFSFDFKDKILFIEEIGEHFYALDRMLMALDLAGVFESIKGIIVGGMTNMGEESNNDSYSSSFDEKAYQIIAHRLKNYRIPKLFGFPNGHIYENQPIIIGAEVELTIDKISSVIF